MGFFTSKVLATVLVGGTVSLGALGLTYTGGATLDNADATVTELGQKIKQFETNEGVLVNKIGEVKTAATEKLTAANTNITNLNGKVAELNTQITKLSGEKADLQTKVAGLEADVTRLNGEITALKADLSKEQGDHAATKDALAKKTAEYDAKVSELATTNGKLQEANKQIANYEAIARDAVEKAKVADKAVTELEGEVIKANADVEAHGKTVEGVKTSTSDDKPLTADELAKIKTTVDVEVTPVAENK